MHIKNRIGLWRERRGMTQIELAKLLRVHPNAISSWETGKHVPLRRRRRLLARFLRTTEEELFPE